MLKKLKQDKPHYFSKHPSRGLKGLYWSVGLKGLGLAAFTLFEPIFLYTLGYSLSKIILFYILIYGIYILIMPLVVRLVGRIGFEHSIFYSQFILVAYFILFLSIKAAPELFYVAPIAMALYKSMYWPAYHADFVLFSQDGQRGREVSGIETLNMLVYIIGPVMGGLVLEISSFTILFSIVAIIVVLSSLPLLRIKEVHSRVQFRYRQVFRRMVDKEHRRSFFAYLGFGEELIVLTIWPVFIYLVIGDYLEVGSLAAVATFATSIVVLLLGKFSDSYKRVSLLKFGSVLYFITWLIRGLARNAWQVVSLDTGSRIAKEMLFIPLQSITYTRARQTEVLTHAVFFEQSLSVGKVLAGFVALLIFSFFAEPWLPLFIVSGLFSLLYMFLKNAPDIEKAPHH